MPRRGAERVDMVRSPAARHQGKSMAPADGQVSEGRAKQTNFYQEGYTMILYSGTTDAGRQVLVTVRDDDTAELAFRANEFETWGRPVFLERVPDLSEWPA